MRSQKCEVVKHRALETDHTLDDLESSVKTLVLDCLVFPSSRSLILAECFCISGEDWGSYVHCAS